MLLGGAGALAGGAGLPLVQGAVPRLVLVPVAFRLALFLQAIWAGGPLGAPVLALAIVLYLVPNLAEVAWVFHRSTGIRPVLAADTAYTLVTSVAAALFAGHAPGLLALTWPNIMGTVMVWTLLRGAPAGALAITGAVLLRYGMAVVSGTSAPATWIVLALVAAAATALAIVLLVAGAMRFAHRLGEQRGRAAERERHRRDVHDTVLQVMESLALPAPRDALDPVGSLDQVRSIARAHALRLRLSLDGDEPAEPGGLEHRLGALAVEMTAEGLRVDLVPLAKLADVPENVVGSLHDAAREALRNTLKHAKTPKAVVCLEEHDGIVTVSVRDHGTGFDVGAHRAGFGIENSIHARMAEIGGAARIESAPGQGTRVVLTAPLELRFPVG
ncbi:ATP-binding protein [Amycolatopsis mongoliensis]|uniref:ATP-binding protein n=1 Tax=Amycolatopsis mongoliensis TaxID=715475 RepID=A0A9Y2K1K1_9PSEU|nr:ATP-binding protein [Amycolatopsis sp. 4-36]WIY07659.1 ATP-binding protein [Amycolatopsis sp. 4-36]